MKVGKYKKFSRKSGIAKIQHAGEEWFVVYSDYIIDLCELGKVVGKGKTELEAMKNAIVNLSDNLVKMSNEIDDFKDNLKKLKICNDPLNFNKKPIIPVEGWETKYIDGVCHYVNNGEYYNADLGFDENGNVVAFLA